MPDPGLTVAISTHGPRAAGLTSGRLPALPGIDWLILIQDPPALLPAFPGRPDIAVTVLGSRGVSASRNAAIDRATGAALLFADDDLTFDPAGLAAMRDRIATAPEAILTGRLTTPEGRLRKRYGKDGASLNRLNIARCGTPEIALRLAPVRAAGLRFDEAFGAGTPAWMGEEFIFLADALKAGLAGRHVAIRLGSHPAESSGVADTAEAWVIRRAVFARALGRLAMPARVAFGLLRRRRFPTLRHWWAFVRP